MVFKLFKKKPSPPLGSSVSNSLVRAQLKKMGDDGAKTRHVIHYAYPQDGADPSLRDAMIERLRADGYDVKDAVHENGLVLEHYREVASEAFNAMTVDLSRWFAEMGWAYDGWECAVVSEKTAPH